MTEEKERETEVMRKTKKSKVYSMQKKSQSFSRGRGTCDFGAFDWQTLLQNEVLEIALERNNLS